nr:hypothetical protein [Candidatus Dependentiae bacterium]
MKKTVVLILGIALYLYFPIKAMELQLSSQQELGEYLVRKFFFEDVTNYNEQEFRRKFKWDSKG